MFYFLDNHCIKNKTYVSINGVTPVKSDTRQLLQNG